MFVAASLIIMLSFPPSLFPMRLEFKVCDISAKAKIYQKLTEKGGKRRGKFPLSGGGGGVDREISVQ